MPSRLAVFEQVMKKQAEAWLATLEAPGYVSCPLRVYEPVKDIFTDVYQRESGEEASNKFTEIQGLVIGDSFFPSDMHSAGAFAEGWLMTTSDKVKVGSLIEIVRSGFESRRYKVNSIHKIGTTVVIYQKFRLAALGD